MSDIRKITKIINDSERIEKAALEKLEDAVSDIFVEIQTAENITDGCIPPWDDLELETLELKLSRLIAKVIVTELNRKQ